jgi:uncharacterized sulfatase
MQYSDFSEPTPTRKELRRLAAEGKLTGAVKDFMSPVKASEELYDTEADPHEIHNLAGSPERRPILERLRDQLHGWMIDTRDTGLLPEVEMRTRSAGGSPYDMARQGGRFDVSKVLAAAELVGRGLPAREQMTELLSDPDAAIRYWAATGLAALGADAAPGRQALIAALSDPAPNVRFAAAESLCHVGGEVQAVPVLIAGLQDQDPVVRLYAAITLVAIGDEARPALSQMKATAESEAAEGTYPLYIRWALNHAVRQLGADGN